MKRTKPVSLDELWAYEASHPVLFASPRALAEARMIADLSRTKHGRRVRENVVGANRSHRPDTAK